MKFILDVLAVIFMFAVVAVLIALPVMLLWNYVMPDIFGLAKISFWQALALTILFRSFTYQSSSK